MQAFPCLAHYASEDVRIELGEFVEREQGASLRVRTAQTAMVGT